MQLRVVIITSGAHHHIVSEFKGSAVGAALALADRVGRGETALCGDDTAEDIHLAAGAAMTAADARAG